MQITIFGGTGSLGAYFAYRLVKAQHNVTIIGRENSPNLKQIAEIGLTIKFHNETVFVPSMSFGFVGAYNYSSLTIKQDLVIVSLKQPNFDITVARQISNLTDRKSVVGVISNGLPFYFLAGLIYKSDIIGEVGVTFDEGQVEVIKKYGLTRIRDKVGHDLGSKVYVEAVDPDGEIWKLMQTEKLMTIMPLMGSNIESPGVIKVANQQDKIKTFIGGRLIAQTHLEPISQALNDSLIPNTIATDINKNLLEKLQFSLAINVMSALLDQHNGQVFQDESNQNYVRYVITFVNDLAKALGIESLRNYNDFKALNISENRYSSMHEDLANGKVPEVKVIISAPLELAHHFNLTIPTKPLELLEALIIAKSNNISISLEQIQEIYYEAGLALNVTEVTVNMIGEEL